MNARSTLLAVLAGTVALTACKPPAPPAATTPASPAATAEIRIGDLLISDASSRETPVAGGTGPGFMTIRNAGTGDDRLLSASSPAVASVEIHEMSMADGQMTMRALPDGLPIPAGGQVELAPGGLHLMLIGVRQPLAAGQTLPLELRFEKAGAVTVELWVRARG
ncbi:MAG: hypothetical protein C0434_10900 [Xanthomonadaceae bacterium]|nr:hypothetical protein [Xanthomonadaceae bacterium]